MNIAVEYAHAIAKYPKFVHQVIEKINIGNSKLKKTEPSEWNWSIVWAVCINNLYPDNINISFDEYYKIALKELNKSFDQRLEDYKKSIITVKLCVCKRGGCWTSFEMLDQIPVEICDAVVETISSIQANDKTILSRSPVELRRLFLKQYELYRTDLGRILTTLF